ncbi:MAG: histidine kinase [Actinomycetota bacterium]|nr:histidine kinase [Actinomycetota bacterium]
MDRTSDLSSAAPSAPVPPLTAAQVQLTRGPPASSRDASEAKSAGDPAEVTQRLAEARDRIAEGLNDVLARRLFAAGIDLQSALGLMGEHRATSKVCHAIDELDQAIRDIRDTIFDSSSQPGPTA